MTASSADEAADRYQDIMDEVEMEEKDNDALPASPTVPTKPTNQPDAKPARPKAGDLRSTKSRHQFIKGMQARRAAASKRALKPNP